MIARNPLPVLMRPEETISIKEAADRAKRNDCTIRRWNKQLGIARQATGGGPWEVSLPALEMVLHGDMIALELLREGKRSAPEVKRYLDFLGLPE